MLIIGRPSYAHLAKKQLTQNIASSVDWQLSIEMKQKWLSHTEKYNINEDQDDDIASKERNKTGKWTQQFDRMPIELIVKWYSDIKTTIQ